MGVKGQLRQGKELEGVSEAGSLGAQGSRPLGVDMELVRVSFFE